MEKHFSLSDLVFEKQFENATLDPQLFSHEAHLRLAWIHATKYGLDEAAANVCRQIAQFDSVHGDGNKFHKTLTVAAVKAVWHFIAKSSSGNFKDFITEFPRLKNNFRELIAFHYSWDIFRDPEAKKKFVEPDLLPFD